MEREYKLSRIIIAVLMMLVSFIMLINEDIDRVRSKKDYNKNRQVILGTVS